MKFHRIRGFDHAVSAVCVGRRRFGKAISALIVGCERERGKEVKSAPHPLTHESGVTKFANASFGSVERARVVREA